MFVLNKFLNEIILFLYYYTISLILSIFVLFSFKYELIYLLSYTLLKENFNISEIIFTNIFEAIKSYLIFILFFSIIINIPLFLSYYLIYLIKFTNEFKYREIIKKTLNLFIYFTCLNFIFLYCYVPYFIKYLLSFQNLKKNFPINIKLQLKLYNYIYLFIEFFIIFNIFLIIPIILNKNKNWILYKKNIYFFILLIFSFITPPDVISLLMILIPIYFFFETIHLLQKIKKNYKKLFRKDGIRTHDSH